MTKKEIETIAKQLICDHKNRCGGNDYILCQDCGLEWNYAKASPMMALKYFKNPITRGYN